LALLIIGSIVIAVAYALIWINQRALVVRPRADGGPQPDGSWRHRAGAG
jgi:hypothetical protein